MKGTDEAVAWAAIDFLSALLLVIYVLIAPPPKPVAVETYGSYAIEVTWPVKYNHDVDTWVQDPDGNLAWFGASDVGLMSLDHDDLGFSSDSMGGAFVNDNRERVVLRGVTPGEYVVNVHAFKTPYGPTPVDIRLYRLRGDDKLIHERKLTLRATGDEQTAFRVVFGEDGEPESYNRLPELFIGSRYG